MMEKKKRIEDQKKKNMGPLDFYESTTFNNLLDSRKRLSSSWKSILTQILSVSLSSDIIKYTILPYVGESVSAWWWTFVDQDERNLWFIPKWGCPCYSVAIRLPLHEGHLSIKIKPSRKSIRIRVTTAELLGWGIFEDLLMAKVTRKLDSRFNQSDLKWTVTEECIDGVVVRNGHNRWYNHQGATCYKKAWKKNRNKEKTVPQSEVTLPTAWEEPGHSSCSGFLRFLNVKVQTAKGGICCVSL